MLLLRALVLGSSIMLLVLGSAAWKSWRIYAGTGKRRQQDASAEPLPEQPAGVRDRAALLAHVGYRPIGKTGLDLPGGRRYSWILAANDGRSYAILVDSPRTNLTAFYSAWPDGTWLGTEHPLGTAVDRRGLRIQVVATSLEAAVSAQRQGVERLRVTHGEPRSIQSMPDMLALDDDYRTRFGGSHLRPLMLRSVVPALLAAGCLVLSLALLALQG